MSTPTTVCPFWSAATGSCSVDFDGLFIPSEAHADTYCTSDAHTRCDRYCGRNAASCVADRRRHRRRAESCPVTLYRNEPLPDERSTPLKAIVVDLSRGGARLLLEEKLQPEATVSCVSSTNLPSGWQSGTASIRWCHRLLNRHGFQAGLAFGK